MSHFRFEDAHIWWWCTIKILKPIIMLPIFFCFSRKPRIITCTTFLNKRNFWVETKTKNIIIHISSNKYLFPFNLINIHDLIYEILPMAQNSLFYVFNDNRLKYMILVPLLLPRRYVKTKQMTKCVYLLIFCVMLWWTLIII